MAQENTQETIKRGEGTATATYNIEVWDDTEDVDVEWIAVVDETQPPFWEADQTTSDYNPLEEPNSPADGDYAIGNLTMFCQDIVVISDIKARCENDPSISYSLGNLPMQGDLISYNGEEWTVGNIMFGIGTDAMHVEPYGDNNGYTNLTFTGYVELSLSRMDDDWNLEEDTITLNVDATKQIKPFNGGFDIEVRNPYINETSLTVSCEIVEKFKVLGEWKYTYKWKLANEDDEQYGATEPISYPIGDGDSSTTQGTKTINPYKYILDPDSVEYDPSLGNNVSNYIRIDGVKPDFDTEIPGGDYDGYEAESSITVEKSFNYVQYSLGGDDTWPTHISQINITPKENTGGSRYVKLNAGNNWEGTLVSYRKPLVIEGTVFQSTEYGATSMVYHINGEYANGTIDEAVIGDICFPMDHGYSGNGSEVTYSFSPNVPVSNGIRTFETSQTYTFTYNFEKSPYRDDEGLENMSQSATLHVVIADIDSIEFDVNGTHCTANSGNNWKVNVEVASGCDITLSDCVVSWSDGTATANPASKMSGVTENVTADGEAVYSAWGYDQGYPQQFTLDIAVKNEDPVPSEPAALDNVKVCGQRVDLSSGTAVVTIPEFSTFTLDAHGLVDADGDPLLVKVISASDIMLNESVQKSWTEKTITLTTVSSK